MIKCFFPYTNASKTQELNYKMNVVPINLETWEWMLTFILIMDELYFHSSNVWMKKIIYIFLINKTSIIIMDECFILLLNFYG